jgi:hypothetical protein
MASHQDSSRAHFDEESQSHGLSHLDSGPNLRRIVSARILSKLALYFLAFGVILLTSGGIRSLFFDYGINARILIVIGSVTTFLGVAYTIIALLFIKSLDMSSALVLNFSIDPESLPRRTSPNQNNISSISANLDTQWFQECHSELKYMESPPSYESLAPKSLQTSSSERVVKCDDEPPPPFASLEVKQD